VFTPCGDGYTFEAPTRFDKLFSGIVVPRSVWAKAATPGTEHIQPEDVYGGSNEDDLDYGRLLERAMANQVKGEASPTGTADGWPLPIKGFSDLKDAA